MNTSKPWYLSRTIWASLITILSSFAGIAGLPIPDADAAATTDLILQAVTAVAGLVAIFGRLSATDRIG